MVLAKGMQWVILIFKAFGCFLFFFLFFLVVSEIHYCLSYSQSQSLHLILRTVHWMLLRRGV